MTSIESAAASANVSPDIMRSWRSATPDASGDFVADRQSFAEFWLRSRQLIECLPPKPKRNEAQAVVAAEVHAAARQSRERFLRQHVEAVYAVLTQNLSRFVRVEHLLGAAADMFPGLVPSAQQIAAEAGTL